MVWKVHHEEILNLKEMHILTHVSNYIGMNLKLQRRGLAQRLVSIAALIV